VYCVAVSADGLIASGSRDRTARLWEAETGRELLCLAGTNEEIHSVAFSADGGRVATLGAAGSVRVFDSVGGQLLVSFQENLPEVGTSVDRTASARFEPGSVQIAFSGDGNHVVWLAKGHVRIVHLQSGELLLVGEIAAARSVCSPDGVRLAIFTNDGVHWFDFETGRHVAVSLWQNAAEGRLRFPGARVVEHSRTIVWMSPDARFFVVGSTEWEETLSEAEIERIEHASGRIADTESHYVYWVRVYDAQSGEQLASCADHSGAVSALTFSPDAAQVASGSEGHAIHLWNWRSGEPVRQLLGHGGAVSSLEYSADGRWLVSGSGTCGHRVGDRTIRIWDPQGNAHTPRLRGHSTELAHCLDISVDGRRIATAGSDYAIRTWDAATGALSAEFSVELIPEELSFSPNGLHFLFPGNATPFLRDSTTGTVLQSHFDGQWEREHLAGIVTMPIGFEGGASVATYSPDGTRILGCGERRITIWDAASGRKTGEIGYPGTVYRACFSPDGNRLAAVGDSGLCLFDTSSQALLFSTPTPTAGQYRLSFSPNGRTIYLQFFADRDARVQVWDALDFTIMDEFSFWGDLRALAGGTVQFPWVLENRKKVGASVRPVRKSEPVAWFPSYLAPFATHPAGTSWAGIWHNHLFLLALEGPDVRQAEAGISIAPAVRHWNWEPSRLVNHAADPADPDATAEYGWTNHGAWDADLSALCPRCCERFLVVESEVVVHCPKCDCRIQLVRADSDDETMRRESCEAKHDL
jgi:WD40 repeat protein